MPVAVSAEAVRTTRTRAESNGVPFWHTTIIGANRYRPPAEPPPGPGALYPMAFLVEQDPETTVQAHFHQADQFQVIVGGDGTLGTHAVRPYAVHFTAAWSPYGPIRASASGISYLTLRNGWDPGARYMPGARAELPRQRRYRETVADAAAAGTLIPLGADGLGAWRFALGADDTPEAPKPASGFGQFWVVLEGALAHAGESFGPGSCLFVGPDEPPLPARAGASGADLLVLQFPRRSVH
ncbi:MAG TPA: hypothetical protein VFA03_05140 [Acetobacteraceae bacterium]|nr:hypothetical protein [Acetobacteraceae bacterium]